MRYYNTCNICRGKHISSDRVNLDIYVIQRKHVNGTENSSNNITFFSLEFIRDVVVLPFANESKALKCHLFGDIFMANCILAPFSALLDTIAQISGKKKPSLSDLISLCWFFIRLFMYTT